MTCDYIFLLQETW